jgi:hypothetical protein
MFPPSNAIVNRNELGEVTGWDVPGEPYYHDVCGLTHAEDKCPEDEYNGEDDADVDA